MARSNPFRSNRMAMRREGLRRQLPRPSLDILGFLKRPEQVRSALILAVFALLAAAVLDRAQRQVLVRPDQVMTATSLWRLDHTYEDKERTEALRTEQRSASPDLYRYNAQIGLLHDELKGLPAAAAGKTIGEISESIVTAFELDDAALSALQAYSIDGQPTSAWVGMVEGLVAALRRRPLMSGPDFEVYSMKFNRAVAGEEGHPEPLPRQVHPIQLAPDDRAGVRAQIEALVAEAGFPAPLVRTVAARLHDRPTLEYQRQRTVELAAAAADKVRPAMIDRKLGDVLYRRGDLLSHQQHADVEREAAAFDESVDTASTWLPRTGMLGLCAGMSAFLGLLIRRGYPRLQVNAVRLAALCGLILAALAASAWATAHAPGLLYAAAIAPTLLVAVVVLLTYDTRLAIVVAALHSALVAVALQQSVAWFFLVLVGCATMIAQLPEVRHRNSLIRAATGTALILGAGSVLLGVLEVPLVQGALRQVLVNGAWAAAGSFSVGFLVLGLLPSIERLFGITTGMTLAELRDPRQPLLRQLQLRAPGTYNHSLQVANIGEAAAQAIGADGLLVYVGALYHDIGKVNKPDYFVENIAGGDNKHEKLSPAMSLLVIIGHVKDGIELACEYGLPRPLIHFIESHHGTTLVEFFYQVARERAEAEDGATVSEVEFRYPGPKPRTREAAIVMLADAVESATRAMAEPNPSRIESLVRQIARRRLVDGQFDECPLTFRDLSLIADAMIGRLCAIHHGRISYPKPPDETEVTAEGPRSASA